MKFIQNFSKKYTDLPLSFKLNEWSGSIGDLGTIIPLLFALVAFNNFPLNRTLFIWGFLYIITGIIYRVPVSVQPLKAMAVIALAQKLSVEYIASISVFYGIMMLILVLTGSLKFIQNWLTKELITGIQIGIGLILIGKAVEYGFGNQLYFFGYNFPAVGYIFIFCISIIYFILYHNKLLLTLVIVVLSIICGILFQIEVPLTIIDGNRQLLVLHMPQMSVLLSGIPLLIIPQLPLTIGNAVIAANRTGHQLWKEQARILSTKRLATSIGISDILCGLVGCFPICHGAGGMAAHAQFGAKTGGSTIIIGSFFILFALSSKINHLLFLVPIPLLASMLFVDATRMINFYRSLGSYREIIIAWITGIICFLSGNLLWGLLAGIIILKIWTWFFQPAIKREVKI